MFKFTRKIYLLCMTGALGDTVSSFPAIKHLIEKGYIEKLFVNDRYLDLYKLVFPKNLIVPLSEVTMIIPKEKVTPDIPLSLIDPKTGDAQLFNYPVPPGIKLYSTMDFKRLSPLHAHLVDVFSASIANCILKDNEKDYPFVPIECLPYVEIPKNKYAVISYGATTEHRRMLPESFNGVKEFLLASGYDVVLLGKKDHELNVNGYGVTSPKFDGINTDGCLNLIDKTSLPESLFVMSNASVVIGVEGGLNLLAAMTNTPIVMGFTISDPYYRVPYRNGVRGHGVFVVEPDSECRYCQTRTLYSAGISFHVCNSKTMECMYSLTTDKWVTQIKKALKA